MVDFYQECNAGFEIPEDSWLYGFLTELAALNGLFFIGVCIFLGPVNVVVNVFVMFILTRKELRSSYNFVFFLMALNQTIVIGSLSILMYKTLFLFECTPWFFSMAWMLFDLIAIQQLIGICKAHTTWLAVIIALMRLMSIRSHGASELQFTLVALLSGASMIFVLIANTPNFISYMIIWIRFEELCDTKAYGDLEIPYVIESPLLYEHDCLVMRLTSFLTGLLHSALPCMLLIILSVTLLRFLRKVRKEREAMLLHKNAKETQDGDRTTTLLILIMISTMISEVPQAILSLLEGFLSSKMRAQVTSKVGNLIIALMLITSAANLLIYLFMSKKFREVAKSYVCFTCRKLRKAGIAQQTISN